MKKSFILLGLISTVFTYAQHEGKVGINTKTPNATLEITPNTENAKENATTNEGVIIPKLTKARVAAIADNNLVKGTLVFVEGTTYIGTNDKVANINTDGFYYYNGTKWENIGTGALPSGTDSGQVLKWNGTAWVAGTDMDTTYTAGKAIKIENNQVSLNQVVNSVSNNYTLAANMDKNYLRTTAATPITITVPDDLPVGYSVIVMQQGDGSVTFAGNHLQAINGRKIKGKYAAVGLVKVDSNLVILTGDTTN